MKIRAKANGNIIEASDEEAKELIASGIYEPIDDDGEVITKDSTGEPKRGRSKRRDMRPEE